MHLSSKPQETVQSMVVLRLLLSPGKCCPGSKFHVAGGANSEKDMKTFDILESRGVQDAGQLQNHNLCTTLTVAKLLG